MDHLQPDLHQVKVLRLEAKRLTAISIMPSNSTELHLDHLHRAVRLALEAERLGNLPIGALITLDDEVIAEAGNSVLVPHYHPGRHAEMEALRRVPEELWPRSREMTCYTTLEPCVMCMGALLHGVGRVVFGLRTRRWEGTFFRACRTITPRRGCAEWVGPSA